MRWAKVPEWLLDELVAVPQADRHSVAPGTALAGYVALAVTANFKTGEVRCTPAELARRIAITPRAARRTVALLEQVGALLRGGGDQLWLRPDADLQVRAHSTADLTVQPADLTVPETDPQVRALVLVPAGHGTDPANPLTTESFSETPDASHDAEGSDPWGLTEEVEQHALDESWERWERRGGRAPTVRAMRAASHPPEPGARLQDAGGTPGGDAQESAGVPGATTTESRG